MVNDEILKSLLKEYQSKHDQIMRDYGASDGFIIDGKMWWNFYNELIQANLKKIGDKSFTINDASRIYKLLGFGPKLYERSFLENGLDRIRLLFLFLTDESISASQKIREVAEDSESDHYIKGIGINFVTLFLTTLFPIQYVQWNMQTDGALHLLNCYPAKKRGEKRSDLYVKINQICIQLMSQMNLPSLPVLDNVLYCLNRGYIELPPKIAIQPPGIPDIQPRAKADEATIHTEMMHILAKIGLKKGYDVWVAVNDKGKMFNDERLGDISLQELPHFTNPETLNIAKYIDVIWFKRNTFQPVRFFEIENSTSIYSGLLRINDIKVDYPVAKATIVIPAEKVDAFEKQIERPTFRYSELSDICDCLSYNEVKEWYAAVNIDEQFA